MKILYLTNNRDCRVMDFYAPLYGALADIPGVEVTVIKRHLEQLEGKFCRSVVIDGENPEPLVDPAMANQFDWIVTDAMYSYMTEDWAALTPKKAILWADQHGAMVLKYVGAAAGRFNFDLFCPLYRDATWRFHPYLPRDRVNWFPYWLNVDMFRDYGEPKEIGALMTGVVHQRVYPLRFYIDQALAGQPFYHRVQRPRETLKREGYVYVGEKYARLLNSAKISFAGVSRFQYPVTKFFEIPACRTLLIADWIPEMEDLGYIPGVNYVRLDRTGNCAGTIESWLDNPKREAITDAGFHLMHERYNARRRAGEFVEMLDRYPQPYTHEGRIK